MLELFLYIIVMAITPGPNTILSMANASKVGLRKGITLNLGMLVGITAVTVIAFFSSAFFYSVLPEAERILKAFAFIYLVFLAFKMLRSGNVESGEESTGFVSGMLLQLINVKVYLLAFTAISAYIMPLFSSGIKVFFISLLVPLICFLSGLVWAIGGSILKRAYSSHRKFFSWLFCLSLLWCALRMVS